MHSSGRPADLIKYEELLRAIAKYLYPDPVDLPGLPGVVGKRLLDPKTKIWRNTIPLTAEDQARLRELASEHAGNLPPLETVMGRKESLRFRRAFRRLKGRPDWEPVLRRTEDRWLLHSLRGNVCLRHDTALKKEIAEERMRHFDDDRIATGPHFERISYLLRDEVHAYLQRVGLDLQVLLNGPSKNPPSTAFPVLDDSPSPASAYARSLPEIQKRRRHNWSPEFRQKVIEAASLGRLELVAVEFDISLQYAKQLSSRFLQEARADQLRAPSMAPPAGVSASSLVPISHAGSTGISTPLSTEGTFAAVQHIPGANPPASSIFEPFLEPPQPLHSPPHRIVLRMREVEQRIGLKRSSIYERLNPNGKYYDRSFPRPVSLTGAPAAADEDRPTGGAIGFHQDEIDRWLAARPKR